MKKQQIPKKEQDKTLETDINENGISDLPDKASKIMIIKMLTNVRRTMHEQNKTFNKVIKITK